VDAKSIQSLPHEAFDLLMTELFRSVVYAEDSNGVSENIQYPPATVSSAPHGQCSPRKVIRRCKKNGECIAITEPDHVLQLLDRCRELGSLKSLRVWGNEKQAEPTCDAAFITQCSICFSSGHVEMECPFLIGYATDLFPMVNPSGKLPTSFAPLASNLAETAQAILECSDPLKEDIPTILLPHNDNAPQETPEQDVILRIAAIVTERRLATPELSIWEEIFEDCRESLRTAAQDAALPGVSITDKRLVKLMKRFLDVVVANCDTYELYESCVKRTAPSWAHGALIASGTKLREKFGGEKRGR
jgi:hypothetical protein